LAGYWFTEEFTRKKAIFLGYMLMVLAPFFLLACLRFLFSDRVVLQIGPRGIEYKTLFGSQRVAWRDFRGAAVETITTRGAIGGSNTAQHLKLDFGKGFFGNCKISEKLLESSVGGIEPMLTTLQECMQGAAALDRGEYHHSSLGAGAAPAGHAHPEPVLAMARGFGRKGL
jgi:hypothetical protein